jgi:hypothetical protein
MKVIVLFSSSTGPYSFSWVVVGSGHFSAVMDLRFLQF